MPYLSPFLLHTGKFLISSDISPDKQYFWHRYLPDCYIFAAEKLRFSYYNDIFPGGKPFSFTSVKTTPGYKKQLPHVYCTATVFCPISSSLFFTPQIKYFKLILLIITIYRKAENSHEKQAGHEPPDFIKRTSSYFLRLGKMYTGTVLRPWCPAILHHPFCAERTGIFLNE